MNNLLCPLLPPPHRLPKVAFQSFCVVGCRVWVCPEINPQRLLLRPANETQAEKQIAVMEDYETILLWSCFNLLLRPLHMRHTQSSKVRTRL